MRTTPIQWTELAGKTCADWPDERLQEFFGEDGLTVLQMINKGLLEEVPPHQLLSVAISPMNWTEATLKLVIIRLVLSQVGETQESLTIANAIRRHIAGTNTIESAQAAVDVLKPQNPTIPFEEILGIDTNLLIIRVMNTDFYSRRWALLTSLVQRDSAFCSWVIKKATPVEMRSNLLNVVKAILENPTWLDTDLEV